MYIDKIRPRIAVIKPIFFFIQLYYQSCNMIQYPLHYVGVTAMKAIPRYLSYNLNIELNTRIKMIVLQHTKAALKRPNK